MKLPLLSPLAIFILALCVQAPGHATEVKKYPVSDFYKDNSFEMIRISPTGEYLAASVPQENRTVLIILRLADMKMTGKVVLQEKAHITRFYWVNNERILFNAAMKIGRLSQPKGLWAIYGVNADGSKQGHLSDGTVLSRMLDDDNNVLVSTNKKALYGDAPIAQRMNVMTGTEHGLPVYGPEQNCDLEANALGDVYFAYCSFAQQITQRLFFKETPKASWELINKEADTNQSISILGYSADSKKAYLQIEDDKGPDGVYEFDMATRQKTLLMRDDNVNPESVLTSPIDGGVYAIRFNDGLPRTSFIQKDNPYAQDLKKLLNAFPEDDVWPTSYTKDGQRAIYMVSSDTRPAEFYLYDRSTGKVSIVASSASWFKSEDMAVMTPVKFKARDGLDIDAFLTVPRGSNGKNLPVVINPHGGPFGVYDTWGFNPETQLLANRGYAVMQVNFRGSGNYGKEFLVKGYHGWGRAMQDDLTDATQWLIKQGIADSKRICIYGASYGAYAALMGAAKESGLYQCAIGNVGVYDLAKVYTDDSDVNTAGRKFFDLTMGSEDFDLYSPNLVAHKIKIPVLLAAGDSDETAPPVHTKRMQAALEKNHIPVETVIYAKEGHGNYLMVNKLDFAERLLAFLDKHIGSPKKPAN
ncbi:MAG: S9 family peptidase [Arenimonas sp.]